MSIDFLCEMLGFPWLPVTHSMSPAQVVLGIALNHKLLPRDGNHRIQRVLQGYIETYSEIAAKEFPRIEKLSPEIAKAIWSELPSSIRDDIAFSYHQEALDRHLRELFHRSFKQRFPTTFTASHLTAIQRQIDLIRQQAGAVSQLREPGELLLAALPSEELEESIPYLWPWVQAQCPPFIRQALFDSAHKLDKTARDFQAGVQGPPKHRERDKESLAIGSLPRKVALDELAEKLRDSEIFAPRRHSPFLERLTPAEFSYLCGAMDVYPRWGYLSRRISSQYALFVRGLDHTYILNMLETPWLPSSREFGVLRILYKISLSTGILTSPHRSRLALAFAKFLNGHGAQSSEEFLNLYDVCSLTFAKEIWSELEEDVRTRILLSFPRNLARRLEHAFWDPRELVYLGHKIERVIDENIRSDETSEVRNAAIALSASYRDLQEAIRSPDIQGFQLLGLLSVLTSQIEEENLDGTVGMRKVLDSLPEFIAAQLLAELEPFLIGRDKSITDEAKQVPFREKYRISIAHPKLLSKQYSSQFQVHIYLPEMRPEVLQTLVRWHKKQEIAVHTRASKVKTGQEVKLTLFGPGIAFSGPVIKKLDNSIISTNFTAKPDDRCYPGNHKVILSISDVKTPLEYQSIIFTVKVTDFAFDHISRPLLSSITSVVLGAGSLIMFILTLLGQIDTTFGLASGTVAGTLASAIYVRFLSFYQQPKITNTP
jgi:hypothetical protein